MSPTPTESPLTPLERDVWLRTCQAQFLVRLERAWELAGRPQLTTTSGERSIGDNQRVGGQPDSQHLIGLAVDFVGPSGALALFEMACMRLALSTKPSGTHLHVQMFPASDMVVARLFPELLAG